MDIKEFEVNVESQENKKYRCRALYTNTEKSSYKVVAYTLLSAIFVITSLALLKIV